MQGPGTYAVPPEGMPLQEFYNREADKIQQFIDGNFAQHATAVVTMPSTIYDRNGGYDQHLWFRTTDGGTIELQRTFRRENDENPTDWFANVFGPDVEGFHPALRAYVSHSEGSSRPGGGFMNPEYPDGDFDNNFDKALIFAQNLIASEPMPANEAIALMAYRHDVGLQLSQEMRPFLIGSQKEFRLFRVDYDERRTAAINGDVGRVALQPIEQDLSIVEIPLAETAPVLSLPEGIDDNFLQQRINELLIAHRESAFNAHLISWNGGMVPHGAIVGGREIAGMQHGLAVDTDGELIGTYDRLVMPSGRSLRNEVLVYMTLQDNSASDSRNKPGARLESEREDHEATVRSLTQLGFDRREAEELAITAGKNAPYGASWAVRASQQRNTESLRVILEKLEVDETVSNWTIKQILSDEGITSPEVSSGSSLAMRQILRAAALALAYNEQHDGHLFDRIEPSAQTNFTGDHPDEQL